MVDVSHAVRDPGGRVPCFGDADDGRVLPAGRERPATHDHLLWAAAALLGTDRPGDGLPSPEVAWNYGVGAWQRAREAPRAAAARSRAFRDGGIFVLAGNRGRAVVRCGDVGQNGNGGHAHNDLFSYELSYDRPVVVDPGTYVYTADPGARNRFRSTAAHSTVTVDEEEINPIRPGQLFRLRQVARPQVLSWEADDEGTRLVAAHDGYRRLPARVTHERSFELGRSSGTLAIRDRLTGTGEVVVRCRVHLAPDADPAPSSERSFELCGGDVALEFDGDGIEVTVEDGEVSPSYGVRVPAPVIVATVSGALPLRLGHRFSRRRPG
jgi:hypothetical protein